MKAWPKYKPNGDSAVLIEFENAISEQVNDKVRCMAQALKLKGKDYILELLPTYRSLCVFYNPLLIDYRQIVEELSEIERQLDQFELEQPTIVEIPVCYDAAFGLDLSDVAKHNNLTIEQVVEIHSSVDYRIYMLGFTPGFPYLGGMDRRIATPRLAKPRLKIAAGSVGIAGEQTGVYPAESPGGWRIIGRTPLKLYDACRINPVLLKAGDYVRFCPISRRQYDALVATQINDKPVKKLRGESR